MSDDPAIYLKQPPTPEEHILSEQVGLHDGAEVPFWMFAKVAVRQRAQAMWISGIDAIARRIRRHFMAGLGALVINLTAIGGYAYHRAVASGAAEEHAANVERVIQEHRDAVEREIQDLRLDIRELRSMLHKMTDNKPNSDVSLSLLSPFDKGSPCCALY